jgi:hypothetical protein
MARGARLAAGNAAGDHDVAQETLHHSGHRGHGGKACTTATP